MSYAANDTSPVVDAAIVRKPYTSPRLDRVGTLAALTQGFAGSVPDEQGGQTKRNPFQG